MPGGLNIIKERKKTCYVKFKSGAREGSEQALLSRVAKTPVKGYQVKATLHNASLSSESIIDWSYHYSQPLDIPTNVCTIAQCRGHPVGSSASPVTIACSY